MIRPEPRLTGAKNLFAGPFFALPIETKVESRTYQSKSGASINVSNRADLASHPLESLLDGLEARPELERRVGCRPQGEGRGVSGVGLRAQGAGLRVLGSGSRVSGFEGGV